MSPDKIKKLRLKMGLTQTEFGDKLKVKRISVYRWEMGIKAPSDRSLYAIKELERKSKK